MRSQQRNSTCRRGDELALLLARTDAEAHAPDTENQASRPANVPAPMSPAVLGGKPNSRGPRSFWLLPAGSHGDPATLNTHVEGRLRHGRRAVEHHSVPHGEHRPMPWTGDRLIGELAFV